MAQKGKQPQRAPGAHEAPAPEEENPRVRCWKCGAYGHKASSLRCPMKRCSRARGPHALGSNQMRQSRNSWTPRDSWNPGPFSKAARLAQQRVRHEEQRQALHHRLRQKAPGGPQHNWKNRRESRDYARVRCWNCREFGHKANSHRCPLRHSNRAQAPQAVGYNKENENLKQSNPWVQRNQGRLSTGPKETEQRARHEEKRQAPCGRLPWRPTGRPQQICKEETEPCGSVRDPHTPKPDHNTKRKFVGDPDLNSCSPKRKRAMTSIAPPIKGVERSICSSPGSKNGEERPVTESTIKEGTHFVQDPTHSVQERDNRLTSSVSTQGLDQTITHQPQAKFSYGSSPTIQHTAAHTVGQESKINIKVRVKRAAMTSNQSDQKPTKKARLIPSLKSTQCPDVQPLYQGPQIKTRQPCHMPRFPPIPAILGQPIHKVFRTTDKGLWSCLPMTPPSHSAAEKPSTPAHIPPTPEKSEALCPCYPLSVLLEALQLSSSS